MELRQRALAVLCSQDPQEKASLAQDLYAQAATLAIADTAPVAPEAHRLPGKPAQPELLAHTAMAQRTPATTAGRVALIHAIAHIEFNAINLAVDAVWRFDGMPHAYYLDWLRVAAEEAKHFLMLREHLQSMGHDYGDLPAHQGLWTMCEKTAPDIVARMALVPRTLEARGLDATPLIQEKLRRTNAPDALRAVAILEVILQEEVGHVAIGNHWYRWLCAQQGLDPVAHYGLLVKQYGAPRLKPPFNLDARRAAGFTDVELDWLAQMV